MKKIGIKYLLLITSLLLIFSSASAQKNAADGPYKQLHSNGNVHIKGHYKNGQMQGIWYEYDENGNMIKKEKYRDNLLLWQIFYEKGKVIRSVDKNGKVKVRPACGC